MFLEILYRERNAVCRFHSFRRQDLKADDEEELKFTG